VNAAYLGIGAALLGIGASLIARSKKVGDAMQARNKRLSGILLIMSGAVFIATAVATGG